MPEFLTLTPPDLARALLLTNITAAIIPSETVDTELALGRVTAADVTAPHPLPAFTRSTVDGFAVRARDTYGASESMPAYLVVTGEVPMGAAPNLTVEAGQCALIHTGGMLPAGADAVVMVEYAQAVRPGEVEIQKSVAGGENLLRVGEDVAENQVVIPRGRRLRPAELGGLMALGITQLKVARKPRIAIISSGDEVVPPDKTPAPGQVRDVNTHTLSALVRQAGAEVQAYGIIPDKFEALKECAGRALLECDAVLITAGSSASIRDMTADVIASLGSPGVLVHGINTRPGKPTILGACEGKAVIGLPGNPVSALVNGYLFVVPVINKLLGLSADWPQASVRATLRVNVPSQAGREDWQPVRLVRSDTGWQAEPVFGKSNLIFSLANADGLVKIHADANGIAAGDEVEVLLMV